LINVAAITTRSMPSAHSAIRNEIAALSRMPMMLITASSASEAIASRTTCSSKGLNTLPR
jgi:hypothetical protein